MDPTPPPPAAVPPPAARSWWDRNWKWVVPSGCLTIILGVLAFVAVIVFVVFGTLRSSTVYKHSLAAARSNPLVLEALGTPIDDGLWLSGNTSVNGASGQADFAIPISGPKGKGTIHVAATKSVGQWNYDKLLVEITATGERVQLSGAGEIEAAGEQPR